MRNLIYWLLVLWNPRLHRRNPDPFVARRIDEIRTRVRHTTRRGW